MSIKNITISAAVFVSCCVLAVALLILQYIQKRSKKDNGTNVTAREATELQRFPSPPLSVIKEESWLLDRIKEISRELYEVSEYAKTLRDSNKINVVNSSNLNKEISKKVSSAFHGYQEANTNVNKANLNNIIYGVIILRSIYGDDIPEKISAQDVEGVIEHPTGVHKDVCIANCQKIISDPQLHKNEFLQLSYNTLCVNVLYAHIILTGKNHDSLTDGLSQSFGFIDENGDKVNNLPKMLESYNELEGALNIKIHPSGSKISVSNAGAGVVNSGR